MTKIYKYFPHEILETVFQRSEFCGLKCSNPEEYNDPFELFLSIDLNIHSHLLAFYNDVVQEIQQLPTTCFSKSPIVLPMWAHYAKNQSGFVLEFEVNALKKWNGDFKLKDVTYRNTPNEKLLSILTHAAGTKKPRHSFMLLGTAFHTAYFTKLEQWSYEKECRFIVSDESLEIIDGCKILFVPIEMATSIIFGTKFPRSKLGRAKDLAEANNLEPYQLCIGKSTNVPFMKGLNGKSHCFASGSIVEASKVCARCGEPVLEKLEFCQWCRITDNEKIDAVHSNPFRILDAHGQLESYLDVASKVRK